MAKLVGFVSNPTVLLPQSTQGIRKQKSTIVSTATSSHSISRRRILQYLLPLSLVPYVSPSATEAVCGDPDSFLAHFVDWREDLISLDSRNIHYRLLGTRRKESKAKKLPVLFLGDAGVGLSIWETMELLSSTDRRLLFFDSLGVGDSEKIIMNVLTDPKERLKLAVEEAIAVLKGSGITPNSSKGGVQQIHVVAAGYGVQVADALYQSMKKEDSMNNLSIASVVIEAWRGAPQEAEPKQLVGSRICAAEAVEAGNQELVNTVYARGYTNEEIVKNLAKQIPTLILRTNVQKVFPEDVGEGLLKQVAIDADGRLPHLVAPQATIDALDDFFSNVEKETKT